MSERPAQDGTTDGEAALFRSMSRYESERANKFYHSVWGESLHFGRHDPAADAGRGPGEAPGDDAMNAATAAAKRAMAEAAGLSSRDHVLEVAAGWGATACFLAREFGCRVTATNVSRAHLATAERAAMRSGLAGRVDSAYADYHVLPFPDAAFDVYLAQESLVHAADKDAVFAEALRVLRPGGRLVVTDQTTRAEWLTAAERRRFAERHGSPDLWDAGGFAGALARAGFTAVVTEDWSEFLAPHFSALVRRIEARYDDLVATAGSDIVEHNLKTWRFAAAKAREGAIGWHLFRAVRP